MLCYASRWLNHLLSDINRIYAVLTSDRFSINIAGFTLNLSRKLNSLWAGVKLRPTRVFIRRPSRLELTCWKCAKIDIYSRLQTLFKDVFIRADYAFSALKTILPLMDSFNDSNDFNDFNDSSFNTSVLSNFNSNTDGSWDATRLAWAPTSDLQAPTRTNTAPVWP